MTFKWEYRYFVVAIYAIVLFIDRLDLTIVNIALPAIAAHFHILITETEWINNAFLLALTLSIPISGWSGDRFGDKKVFVLAVVLFGISSLLCAKAPTLTLMIIMRFLQGIAGGLMIPVGMGMVFRAFKPAEYVSIASFIFIPTLIAPSIAPALGGFMVDELSWTWVFLFAVPLCAIIALLSILFLRENKCHTPKPLDAIGFMLSAITLTLILYGLSLLGHPGYNLLGCGIVGIAGFFGYLFFRQEKKIKHPLIDIKFFQTPLFLQANKIQMAFQICHFGSLFLVGIYLQTGAGMNAMQAGTIMGMQAVGAICISRFSVKLFNEFSAKLPLTIGLAGVALLSLAILWIDSTTPFLLCLSILFFRGLFSGLCGAPLQAISILSFHTNEVSRASAVFNIGRQVSISLGIALSSVLLGWGLQLNSHHLHLFSNKTPYVPAFLLLFITALWGVYLTRHLDDDNIKALRSD